MPRGAPAGVLSCAGGSEPDTQPCSDGLPCVVAVGEEDREEARPRKLLLCSEPCFGGLWLVWGFFGFVGFFSCLCKTRSC